MEISQKIIDYAIWYYTKYFPSKEWLKRKLEEKFWPNSEKWKIYWWINDEEINFIVDEKLKSIIFEKQVARTKIKNYVEKNKNLSYIKNKMFQNFFDKDLVLSILSEEYNFENETLLSEEKLKKQIFSLKQKWKSKNYIKQKFLERSQDRELVEKILEEFFQDWEYENIKKEYEKIENKWFSKQKIMQKLFAKWFNYSEIKRVLED